MRVAVGLGCSLGNRRERLEATVRRIARWHDVQLLRCSRWYRTPPMRGGTARNPFLNGVVLLCTSLRPEELLELCQAEERRAGRRRATFWGDRTLDLDLLVVDGLVRESPALTLPHPGVSTRDFVRRPLLEVWPDVVHAAEGVPLADLPSARLPVAWAVGQLARGVYQRVENNPC